MDALSTLVELAVEKLLVPVVLLIVVWLALHVIGMIDPAVGQVLWSPVRDLYDGLQASVGGSPKGVS